MSHDEFSNGACTYGEQIKRLSETPLTTDIETSDLYTACIALATLIEQRDAA